MTEKKVKSGDTTEKIVEIFLGCSLVVLILFVSALILYWLISHQLHQLTDWVAAEVWSPTPMLSTSVPVVSLPPSTTPAPAYTPTFTPTWTPTGTPSFTSSPTFSYASRSALAEALIVQAKSLMNEKKYAEAIAEWDQVINWVPENADAYYQRASCYLELIHGQHFRDEYLANLYRALADLDQAIALDPAKGDYYMARYHVYEPLANEEPYRLDYVTLEEIALDNLRMANHLGNTEPDSERLPVFVLFDLGRCEEGLLETWQLIDDRGLTAPPSAGLNRALGEGYLCVGQLDEALEHIDLAIELYPRWEKTWTKIVILYNLGRLDDALALLNDDITQFPDYAGYRYFLRAAIYAEQGKLADAEADIEFGYGQTWGYFGILQYAEGRLALARNDYATALEKLQYAEATLSYSYGPSIERVQREVANLGGQLLTVTPEAFVVTPIATPQVTAAPRATSTFVYQSLPTDTPLPQLPPQATSPLTFDVYWKRDQWLDVVGESRTTEDFEKDESDYGELSFPYVTGNGFILTGQSVAQIFQDVNATSLNGSNLLHFRDWGVGLTFTFPDNTEVSAFGFDYRPSEDWLLTVDNSVVNIPAGRKGFVGIVMHTTHLTKFTLSCTGYAQGGLSVDNISYIEK